MSPDATGDLVSARRHGTSSTPDATTSSNRDTRIRRESGGDLGSASKHDQSTTNRSRGATAADAVSPGGSVTFPSPTDLQEVEAERRTRKSQAARTKHSPARGREEPKPSPSRDAAAGGGGKVRSPPRPRDDRRIKPGQDLAPLRAKILNAVDALKGDLSELFSKSPDLNPTRRARPPRRPSPKQEETRAHRQAARAVRPGQLAAAPLRGLPSRRYRRCRAGHPHHGCCCGRHHRHGKAPECGRHEPPSAPRTKAPAPPATKKEEPRKRHHCRPVLKGAPFLICSHCVALVQVPADFAVPTYALRRLRCGACSAVLSYSYRDPARKKQQPSVDQLSADGSDVGGKAGAGYPADPFAPFFDGLSSYSTTEDEQPPLHVSRNTSLDTLDGVKGVGRLHRLMGYGSASELLRRSPDLYESLDERTTPDYDYDRKGKGVCVDDGAEDDFDDSDDEADGGALKRSAARGAVWPLPGKGAPAPGAIRIKS